MADKVTTLKIVTILPSALGKISSSKLAIAGKANHDSTKDCSECILLNFLQCKGECLKRIKNWHISCVKMIFIHKKHLSDSKSDESHVFYGLK